MRATIIGLAVWAGTICLMFSSIKYFGKDYCHGKKVEKVLDKHN